MSRSVLLLLAASLAAAGLAAQTPGPASPPPASPDPSARPEATSEPAHVEARPEALPPGDERLRRVQQRRQSLEREVAKLRGQEKSLLGDVERLELEVRLRGEELKGLQLVLEKANREMEQATARTRELERSVAAMRPALAARARALYKLGELSYLRLLLSVDRPSDIFRGYAFVSALARHDNQRLAAFRADQAALASVRQELQRRTKETLDLRQGVERARRSLDADRKRKEALLTDIVEKKEIHAAYLKELQDAEQKLHALLDGLAQGEVAVPIGAFKGSLPWPVAGRVRVPFGLRKHPKFDTYTIQNGLEIEAAPDSPVTAVHEGTVAYADRFLGYGLMVVIDHGGKHHTLYAHLGEAAVKAGDKLAAGQRVGAVGSTGLEGPGLYFEMRFQGKPEDPAEWLKR